MAHLALLIGWVVLGITLALLFGLMIKVGRSERRLTKR
jgi:hypothetical protein